MLKISTFVLESQSSSATVTVFRPTWYDLFKLSFPTTSYAHFQFYLETFNRIFHYKGR